MIKFFVTILAISVIPCDFQSLGIRKYFRDLPENFRCGYEPLKYAGKCKKANDCPGVFSNGQTIEICSVNYRNPDETLICCSPDDFYKTRPSFPSEIRKGPLDYETCIEKYKKFRTVEDDSAIIFTVNGVNVKQGEFSHSTALGWITWGDLSVDWRCSGSLITESFVVTAAHCATFRGINPQVVRVGDVDLNSLLDDSYVQQKSVLNVIPHPEYDTQTGQNDIALVQMAGEITPTKFVAPSCVYPHSHYPTDYFEVAGYGQNGQGLQTNKLLKVYLKNVSIEKCQNSYATISLSGDTQMCAQSYRDDEFGVQDTCYGDSGSGLQIMTKNYSSETGNRILTPTLIGITNFGVACGDSSPGVYLKISNYISWMQTLISP